jgi:hypothetical protein
MPSKDPKELEAEIEKARHEILELQRRIREMEEKRERLLQESKKRVDGKNGKNRSC